MKNTLLLLICWFFLQKTNAQSITIEPNPANGIMLNIKNIPTMGVQNGTNNAVLIPTVNSLPLLPIAQAGMVVYFNNKLQYYNGTSWIAIEGTPIVQPTLPPTAIVLSETKTNNDLLNAGYSIKGVTNLQYNPYTLNDYAWSKQLNKTNSLLARSEHSAVWTGTNMLIWGGYNDPTNYFYKDGGIYNPTSDTWTTMAASPLSNRSRHTAFWTGTKMIVWGGIDDSFQFNDGAMYDPTLDSWNTISMTNAPSVRNDFCSVWTGDKMIIWGGHFGIDNAGTILGDGKIYNPTSNTWTSMSSTNAPAARKRHSAVWTGSKMIVWGGLTTTSTLTNTGSIYDPSNDSWTMMSTDGSPPSGLFWNTAIWSGTKMIVFGGQNSVGSNVTNECYLYDPVTNVWTTANTTNVPAARSYHSAIWTGTKMIVFGGFNSIYDTNNGGIYDPVTNTWSSNNITLPDFNYKYHSAIWTGEDMIIFGASPGHILKKDFQTSTGKAMYLYQKN